MGSKGYVILTSGLVVSIVKLTLEKPSLLAVSLAQIVTLCWPSVQTTSVILVPQLANVVLAE